MHKLSGEALDYDLTRVHLVVFHLKAATFSSDHFRDYVKIIINTVNVSVQGTYTL